MTEAYDYLPIGTARVIGKSEQEAIDNFLEERPEVSRERIVGVYPLGCGYNELHYSRSDVRDLHGLGYAITSDRCLECDKPLEKPQRGPFPTYCGDTCSKRYRRRRKRERDADES